MAKESKAAGLAVVYHYDVSGHLIAETTPSGTKIRDYYYVADQLVAVDGCVSGSAGGCGDREWYHTDILGNVVARTNRTGAVTARNAYQPWGERSAIGSGTRFFNGRSLDLGTGLYDFGARVYAPELGRFLSTDAAWARRDMPQSANFYALALNNPYKYSDPEGNLPFLMITGAIGAAVGGGIAAYSTYDSQTGFNWAAIGAGAVGGGALGLGLGAVAGVTFGGVAATGALGTGAATASVGEVLAGAGAWGAGALGVGAKVTYDASPLQRASSAAFRAAELSSNFAVKVKHLAGSAGQWAKFAPGTNPNALIKEALSSPSAKFFPNPGTADESYKVITELGRVIGTKGETALRVIFGADGKTWTAFPD